MATKRPIEYEFYKVRISRDKSRAQARQMLTDAAEYGRWELARTRIGIGGTRTYWLRRRIMRLERTA